MEASAECGFLNRDNLAEMSVRTRPVRNSPVRKSCGSESHWLIQPPGLFSTST